MKYSSGKPNRCRTRENRAITSSRFKILLSDAGLSPEAAAQILHVTPRTVRYWISGDVTVPYAAYKLLRVMRLFELPCEGWDGWHMHSGKLWSPEGFGFLPADSFWWNSLVRRARLFHVLNDREQQVKQAMERMQAAFDFPAAGRDAPGPERGTKSARTVAGGVAAVGVKSPVTLHLSLKNETFKPSKLSAPVTFCPATVRYRFAQSLAVKTVNGGGK